MDYSSAQVAYIRTNCERLSYQASALLDIQRYSPTPERICGVVNFFIPFVGMIKMYPHFHKGIKFRSYTIDNTLEDLVETSTTLSNAVYSDSSHMREDALVSLVVLFGSAQDREVTSDRLFSGYLMTSVYELLTADRRRIVRVFPEVSRIFDAVNIQIGQLFASEQYRAGSIFSVDFYEKELAKLELHAKQQQRLREKL